ncbi:MAG TPA: hypothetical protein VHZ95_19445 [Polyangiales bacterium]|nr:hypothetical protein [Polyangiales bacterium]
MRFVDVETAKASDGVRVVLLKGVPSPWSQAAKAIFEIKGCDALAVWKSAGPDAVSAWTGVPNAPVVMFANEPPRSGWAEILALAERLAPKPALVPSDIETRIRMFGLSHELMGQQGLAANLRLMIVDSSIASQGQRGFSLPVASISASVTATARIRSKPRARRS